MNVEPEIVHFRNRIIAAMQLLALPYQEQKKLFPSFVDLPSELLDTFRFAFVLIPQVIEVELFSYHSIAWILRLSIRVNMMDAKAELDDLDESQCLNHRHWEDLRSFASQALIEIGELAVIPDADLI